MNRRVRWLMLGTLCFAMAAAAGTNPILVSTGFEFLNKKGVTKPYPVWAYWQKHQQLNGEPRDAAWAPRVENEIRVEIRLRQALRGRYIQHIELHVLECRTSGCEIQFVGGPDTSFDPLMNDVWAKMENDIEGFAILTWAREDGRRISLVQLTRKSATEGTGPRSGVSATSY